MERRLKDARYKFMSTLTNYNHRLPRSPLHRTRSLPRFGPVERRFPPLLPPPVRNSIHLVVCQYLKVDKPLARQLPVAVVQGVISATIQLSNELLPKRVDGLIVNKNEPGRTPCRRP